MFRAWDAEHFLTVAERGYGGRGAVAIRALAAAFAAVEFRSEKLD